MSTYEDNAQEIVRLGLVQKGFIYQLNEEPEYYDLFNKFYEWAQNRLSELEIEEGISAKFFYNYLETVNAHAARDTRASIIMFNKGYLKALGQFYEDIPEKIAKSPQIQHYMDMPNYCGLTISTFMFRIVSVHSFYHERAHLIQLRGKQASLVLSESTTLEERPFSWDRHTMEFDADWDATRKIYALIRVDFLAQPVSYQTSLNLFKVICVGISSLLLYFYRLHDVFAGIYYEEKSHPHYAIRIGYILHNFFIWMQHDKTIQFEFDLDHIRSQVHRLCRDISGFNPEVMENYATKYLDGMNYYMEKVALEVEKRPYLVKNIMISAKAGK